MSEKRESFEKNEKSKAITKARQPMKPREKSAGVGYNFKTFGFWWQKQRDKTDGLFQNYYNKDKGAYKTPPLQLSCLFLVPLCFPRHTSNIYMLYLELNQLMRYHIIIGCGI